MLDRNVIRIGLLNCRYLNRDKYNQIIKLTNEKHLYIFALTEINADQSLINLFSNTDYPILTSNKNLRIGLLTRSFDKNIISIVEEFRLTDDQRIRTDKTVFQSTLYQI